MRKVFRIFLASLVAASLSGTALALDPIGGPQADAPPDGAPLYAAHCAMCHDHATGRIPALSYLRIIKQPEDVIRALTTGPMQPQATGLTPDQMHSLAIFISGKPFGTLVPPDPQANLCATPGGPIKIDNRQWNGWGRDTDNSRYQPDPGLKAGDVPNLKVKWVFSYAGGTSYAQPTIIGDRLFISTRTGLIHALDAKTGCTHWTFDPKVAVRATLSVGPVAGSKGRYAVYFVTEKGMAYALDAMSGKEIWETRVEDHLFTRLTGAPTLYAGRLYVPLASLEEVPSGATYPCCSFRGGVAAVDAATGKLLWKTHAIVEPLVSRGKNLAGTELFGPAGAGVWTAPTIDPKRKLIYVGTGNSYTPMSVDSSDAIVAFDLDTGKRKWVSQVLKDDNICPPKPDEPDCRKGPDLDFGGSPILRTLPNGKQILVATAKSGTVYAFDPDREGKILWQVTLGTASSIGGSWGSATDKDRIYVGTPGIRPIPTYPHGGVAALDLATGKKLWYTPSPEQPCAWGEASCFHSQPGALTVIPGIVFSGSLDGHLRAYDVKDGSIVWDYDSGISYDAVNGGKAAGGAINYSPQTVANGMLFLNSGGTPLYKSGSALIAFTVGGK